MFPHFQNSHELVIDLGPLWVALCAGDVCAVEHGATAKEFYLVLSDSSLNYNVIPTEHEASAGDGPSRPLPVLFAVAAHASARLTSLTQAIGSARVVDGRPATYVGIPRFDAVLPGELSPREAAVVRKYIEGRTAPQIAADLGLAGRGTKVALATALAKLGIASRAELLSVLIRSIRPSTARATPVCTSGLYH